MLGIATLLGLGLVGQVLTNGAAKPAEALPSARASAARPGPRANAAPVADPALRVARGADPPEVAAALAQFDASLRGATRGAVEDWQCGALRKPLQALAARASTAEGRAAVQARIDRVEAYQGLADAAREFRAALAQSRSHDLAASRGRAGPPPPEGADDPFDAEGLLQATSKRVDGRQVYALIGDSGDPIAFLEVPPGIDADRPSGHRVGVRGASRYEPGLRAPVIEVLDLVRLERETEAERLMRQVSDEKHPR